MDFYGRMGRDFDRVQRDYGGYGQGAGRVASSGGGMQPADWAGAGLQVGGALLQDKAAAEEQAREDEMLRVQMMLDARNSRTSAQQFERSAQQTDRSQNQTGFGMLADQRGRAMDNSRKYSFKKSLLSVMGA